MAQKELPITLEEQIDMMKKYVSFRQRIRMRRFLLHAGYFRASRLGNNLRELREQKRVTQMQVVDVLGVSYTHYAKIEEGMRGMSLKMLIKLIRYFETDANTILGSAAMGVA